MLSWRPILAAGTGGFVGAGVQVSRWDVVWWRQWQLHQENKLEVYTRGVTIVGTNVKPTEFI